MCPPSMSFCMSERERSGKAPARKRSRRWPVSFGEATASLSPALTLAPGGGQEHIGAQNDHTDNERAVGHVEREPAQVVHTRVNEVHHIAQPYAVNQVAERPAQKKPDADPGGP